MNRLRVLLFAVVARGAAIGVDSGGMNLNALLHHDLHGQSVVIEEPTDMVAAASTIANDTDGRGTQARVPIAAATSATPTTSLKTQKLGGSAPQDAYMDRSARSQAPPGRAGSIFCFTVLRPIASEVADALVHLNASTYAKGCDEFRFFSNVSVIPRLSEHPWCGPPQGLAQGSCVERAIHGSMDVKMASWGWYTALNTPIFVQVWAHVLDSGYYLGHAWIIKLDVNVAWRPERLRSYLALPRFTNIFNNGATPLWGLNDYRLFSWPDALGWHLMGGIEVLTRGAIQLYAEHRSLCEDRIAHTYPTEDDYIEYCMRGVGATPVNMPLLLRHGWSHTDEVACVSCFVGYKEFTPPKDWARCEAELVEARVQYVDPAHCSINGELVINYGYLWQEQLERILIITLACIGLALIAAATVFCASRRGRRRAEAMMAKSTPPDERTALYP